jgi:hypothetical protein
MVSVAPSVCISGAIALPIINVFRCRVQRYRPHQGKNQLSSREAGGAVHSGKDPVSNLHTVNRKAGINNQFPSSPLLVAVR